MTIREAVELYQQRNAEISEMKKTARDIASQNYGFRNPLGLIEITTSQFEKIGKWLAEYSVILENDLNATFGKDDE